MKPTIDRKNDTPTTAQSDAAVSRRGFFDRIVAAGFGVASATALTGFAPRTAEAATGMHGPVRKAEEVLKLPAAAWAKALVAPYGDGRPLSDSWAVAYIAGTRTGSLIFVMVDLQTGGHAELEMWGRTRGARALAGSRRYDLHLRRADEAKPPAHLARLGDRLAGVIGRHERKVIPPQPLPARPLPAHEASA